MSNEVNAALSMKALGVLRHFGIPITPISSHPRLWFTTIISPIKWKCCKSNSNKQSFKHFIFCLLEQLAGIFELGIFPRHWWVHCAACQCGPHSQLNSSWAWLQVSSDSKLNLIWADKQSTESLARLSGTAEKNAGLVFSRFWFRTSGVIMMIYHFLSSFNLTVTQSHSLCSIIRCNVLHFDVGFCIWWCR